MAFVDDDIMQQLTPNGAPQPSRRGAWLMAALLIHAAGAAAFFFGRPILRTPAAAPPTELQALSLQDYRQAVADSRQARARLQHTAPRPAAKPVKLKPEELKGQIVEIPASTNRQAPDRASFLAEHNASATRQTHSRATHEKKVQIGHEPTTAPPQATPPSQLPAAPQPEATPQAATAPHAASPDAGKNRVAGPERQASTPQKARDKVALPRNDRRDGQQNQAHATARSGHTASAAPAPGPRATVGGQKPLTMAELIPSIGVLAQLSTTPSDDALQDVDEGDGTFLNAREFKYAAYFMRIKRGVADQWRAADEYQRRDPTGNIYGLRSRTTDVHVTLDEQGGLKKVTLAQSCGIDFLDREGVHAFEAAAPFPNPPKALLDAACEIKFRFSFVFSIGRQAFYATPYY